VFCAHIVVAPTIARRLSFPHSAPINEGNFETIPSFGQEQCSSISAMKQQSTSTNAVQAEWLALGNFIPNIL
jgi:hypothetical protein